MSPRGRSLALALALAAACGCSPRRPFDSDRAFQLLEAQVRLGSRAPNTPAHAAGLEFIRSHLAATADRVNDHTANYVSPLDSTAWRGTNLIAVFNPESTQRILFGAHWDSRAKADEDPLPELRQTPVPGANDGASGVAVLLEVASALKAKPPRVGVDLVFFDAEDQGVSGDPRSYALGSARFVQDFPTYRPAYFVLLDMVGRSGSRIRREANSQQANRSLVEHVFRVAHENGIPLAVDSLGSAVFDDHIAFLEAGIPAVDLIDLDDPHWHTTQDQPEHCSAETLGHMGAWVLALIAEAEKGLSP